MNKVVEETVTLRREDLMQWVEEVACGKVVNATLASGGNRCVGWALDVQRADGALIPLFLRYQQFNDASGGPYTIRREAEIYSALQGTGVCIPGFAGVHPQYQAMLTQKAAGNAAYRALKDESEKDSLARQCAAALAALHKVDASRLHMPAFGGYPTIHEALRAELSNWYEMYRLTGREDALIEFGRAWLEDNLPEMNGPAALVHGDAGPGNFMFEQGKLTALIDWELAHLGDPMEDVAWMSLRSVLEPVPRFPSCIEAYEQASGQAVDFGRVRYHRVFVSWRICVIRHCNASGRAGASVINRALNRRLLIEAIDDFAGKPAGSREAMNFKPREYDRLFEQVLEDIRTVVVPGCNREDAVEKAKDVAKAVKFMRQLYNIGPEVERREIDAIAALLGGMPTSLEAGRSELAKQIRSGSVDTEEALRFFRLSATLETELAFGAMGRLATRHYSPLTD
ncbi:phosphotransferase [Rhizorhapis sp.]|uniref:phosphotransferase n=1 Tax=Rhizorhapis sp. TaxID=1968842 RepID=UPI002B4689D5|nr:phosphotransferase [Rhizorhapis sp.]HKR17938.1 phosphotransferase [Rhizorhapis sp.]